MFDYADKGAADCDAAWRIVGLTCLELESNWFWNCAGCECPGDGPEVLASESTSVTKSTSTVASTRTTATSVTSASSARASPTTTSGAASETTVVSGSSATTGSKTSQVALEGSAAFRADGLTADQAAAAVAAAVETLLGHPATATARAVRRLSGQASSLRSLSSSGIEWRADYRVEADASLASQLESAGEGLAADPATFGEQLRHELVVAGAPDESVASLVMVDFQGPRPASAEVASASASSVGGVAADPPDLEGNSYWRAILIVFWVVLACAVVACGCWIRPQPLRSCLAAVRSGADGGLLKAAHERLRPRGGSGGDSEDVVVEWTPPGSARGSETPAVADKGEGASAAVGDASVHSSALQSLQDWLEASGRWADAGLKKAKAVKGRWWPSEYGGGGGEADVPECTPSGGVLDGCAVADLDGDLEQAPAASRSDDGASGKLPPLMEVAEEHDRAAGCTRTMYGGMEMHSIALGGAKSARSEGGARSARSEVASVCFPSSARSASTAGGCAEERPGMPATSDAGAREILRMERLTRL